MSITEDQAKLIVKDEIEKAQEHCPIGQALTDVRDEMKGVREELRAYSRDQADVMRRLDGKLQRNSETFKNQQRDIDRNTDEIKNTRKEADEALGRVAAKAEAEADVLHGRVTGIIWWLLATCVASVGGLVGIILILIQLFGRT